MYDLYEKIISERVSLDDSVGVSNLPTELEGIILKETYFRWS
jgi:hypothetical protein